MKKIFIPAVLCVLLMLNGCGGDDSPSLVVDPDLVGIWTATSFIASNCEDEANNESNTNLVCTSFECIEFSFADDNSYAGRNIEDSFVSVSVGTWSADNGTLTIKVEGRNALVGTYTVVGDVLTYNYTLSGCDIQIVMSRQ